MAHGFSLTRHDGLPAYAERLAAAGADVLLFDYRHLGDSPGQPRQRFRKAAQLEDWRAAVAAARARPEVDGERIVLWGFSFGGAHAVETAAADGTIAATIAFHRPVMKAPKVRCPLWVGLGDHDISVSGKAVARLAARAPRAELHRYPYSHFEPFMEQAPDKVAADQVDFLRRMGVL
jgi:dienelactone hydrolase